MRKYEPIDPSKTSEKSSEAMHYGILMRGIFMICLLCFLVYMASGFVSNYSSFFSSILKRNEGIKCGVNTYPSGNLEGSKLGGLFCRYICLEKGPITVGSEIDADFCEQLKRLYDMKSGVKQKVLKEKHRKYHEVVHSKKGTARMSLSEFIKESDRALNERSKWITSDCLRNAHPRLSGLSDKRLRAATEIMKGVGATELTAFGLTEIMPSNSGKTNVRVLNFTLKKAGVEFVHSIPSLGDSEYSFGLWQFTSYAISEVGSNRKGASLLNPCLGESMKIPKDVSELKGDDHVVATWLFATINVALWIASLDENQFSELKYRMNSNNDLFRLNMLQLIALSHHRQDKASSAGKSWLNSPDSFGRLEDFADSSITDYAEKTKNNYLALKNGYSSR